MSRPRVLDLAHVVPAGIRPGAGRAPARCVGLQAVRGHDVGARRRGGGDGAALADGGPERRWRGRDGRRVVLAGGEQAPAPGPAASAATNDRARSAAAHRYSSSRSETPHQAHSAATSPASSPSAAANGSHPPAWSSCCAVLPRAASCVAGARVEAANVALPEPSPCPWPARPLRPSCRRRRASGSAGARTRRRPRAAARGRRTPGSAQLGELGGDGRVRGLPGLLERGARAAGDQGQALVRLGVEPGDAGLGGGQRGGVDAVAGGVDPPLTDQRARRCRRPASRAPPAPRPPVGR